MAPRLPQAAVVVALALAALYPAAAVRRMTLQAGRPLPLRHILSDGGIGPPMMPPLLPAPGAARQALQSLRAAIHPPEAQTHPLFAFPAQPQPSPWPWAVSPPGTWPLASLANQAFHAPGPPEHAQPSAASAPSVQAPLDPRGTAVIMGAPAARSGRGAGAAAAAQNGNAGAAEGSSRGDGATQPVPVRVAPGTSPVSLIKRESDIFLESAPPTAAAHPAWGGPGHHVVAEPPDFVAAPSLSPLGSLVDSMQAKALASANGGQPPTASALDGVSPLANPINEFLDFTTQTIKRLTSGAEVEQARAALNTNISASANAALTHVYPALIMAAAAYSPQQQFAHHMAALTRPAATRVKLLSVTATAFPATILEAITTPIALTTSTLVYLVTFAEPGYLALVFRGSDNDDNWRTNFAYAFAPYPDDACDGYCMVHEGYWTAFKTLTTRTPTTEGLRPIINRMMRGASPSRILCAGHSMGGAMATFCGLWALAEFPRANVEVHTFGAPRVGNTDFANFFDERLNASSWRLTYKADIIPDLPGEQDGYVHVQRPIWITNGQDGDLTALMEDRPAWAGGSLPDHNVTNYVAAVSSLLQIPEPALGV